MSLRAQNLRSCAATENRPLCSRAAHSGGSACGYQRDLRDVGVLADPGRLNMQPPGLNIYAPQSCPENARSCREVCVRREHCARSLRGPGIMEANEQVVCPPFPRDCHQLPVTSCQICQRTVVYRPGCLTEVLTGHYTAAPILKHSTSRPGSRSRRPALTPQMSASAVARPQRRCHQDEPGDRRRMTRRSRTLEGRAQVAADLARLCPSPLPTAAIRGGPPDGRGPVHS